MSKSPNVAHLALSNLVRVTSDNIRGSGNSKIQNKFKKTLKF